MVGRLLEQILSAITSSEAVSTLLEVISDQLPVSLGPKAGSASMAVALSTEDQAALAAHARTPTAAAELVAAETELPAAGAYESPVTPVAVPAGSTRAMLILSYTRGAEGGYAAHKIFLTVGGVQVQVQAPDGSYDGLDGRASEGAGAVDYMIDVDCRGASAISIASAEVGVVGTPGEYAADVVFV